MRTTCRFFAHIHATYLMKNGKQGVSGSPCFGHEGAPFLKEQQLDPHGYKVIPCNACTNRQKKYHALLGDWHLQDTSIKEWLVIDKKSIYRHRPVTNKNTTLRRDRERIRPPLELESALTLGNKWACILAFLHGGNSMIFSSTPHVLRTSSTITYHTMTTILYCSKRGSPKRSEHPLPIFLLRFCQVFQKIDMYLMPSNFYFEVLK